MLLSVAVLFLLCPLSSLQSPTTLKRNTTGTGLTSAATVSLSSLPKPLAAAALNTKVKSQQSAPSSPKASPAKANLTLSSSSPSSPKASPAKANLTLSSSSPSSPKASPAKVNQTVSTSSSSSPKANSAKANLTLSSSSSSPKASPAKANLTLSSSSSSPKAKANQTVSSSSSAKPTPAPAVKVVKGKAAPHTHPIKVVITDGCAQKKETNSSTSSSSSSSSAVEKELTLKPGSPLVMTHHINLVPNSCTGGCEAEMAALKGRVEYLEKEMTAMKKMCTSCSAGSCPNSCSSQGRCEEGKCVCNAGFSGADCSVSATCPSNCNKKGKCVKGKCVCNPGLSGVDCSKGTEKKVKVMVETVTMKVTPESNAIKETTTTTIVKKTKADKTIFVKKPESDKEQKVSVAKKEEQGKGLEASQSKTKTTVKTSVLTKVTAKTPSATNGTKTGKVVKTVGQVFLKQAGRRPEQATKGKTEVKKIDTKVKVTTKQEAEKASLKKVQLKDQPFVNVTSVKKTNGTSKLLTQIVKDTKPSVNVTTVEKTVIKTTKVVKTTGTQATDGTVKVTVKTGATKVKPAVSTATTEKDKKVVQANATIVLKEGPVVKKKVESQLNVTTVESKVLVKQTNKTSSKWASSVVSVVAQNITSTSFILTWEASQGLFRNFTLSRRELAAGVEDKEEEVAVEEAEKGKLERQDVTVTGNITEVLKQSSNKTTTTTKVHVSTTSAKAEGKNVRKFTQVLPGTARTFQFRNLRPQTRYALSLFGTAPGFRSKIYRLTVTTGPEPPSELVFTNITETSVSVSWTKPRNTVTGFKVIYTNTATGVSGSLTMDSQLSTVVISKLSAGSSYEISVTSMLESSESDAVVATIITAPDSPTSLQAVNVTDTKALLVWKAAQAKVDRYILSYGSSKSPNVTVTVMLSGNTVEHQLRGLHRSTLYTVRLVSQLNSLQSSQVSTTFTTGSAVKVQSVAPSTVTSGSAVITWKAPHVAFKTYKLTYQLPGEQAKEVFLSPTVIQYELTGLLAGSNYTVKVEGEKEGNYVTVVSTEFTTGALPFHYPTDCSQVHLNGQRESGEAEIFPEGQEGEPVLVYCDMETDGGGWTVFQRRMDGKTDFFRGWKDYSKGFGFLSDEFWLGNDHVHALTSKTPMNLRVDLQVGNETAYAHYANFSLASEENNYTIHVSGYSGNAGDSLRYHSGRPFSTKDKDPQPLSIHCAKAYMGGWWYKNCYKANLNGLYGTFSENQGVVWIDWKGKDISIPFTEMKLRPASFHSVTQG